MVRGFSRFVLFLFLSLLRAPTRNSPERVRDTIWTVPEKSGKHPGLETPGYSVSQFFFLFKNPGMSKGALSGTFFSPPYVLHNPISWPQKMLLIEKRTDKRTEKRT